MSRQPANHCPHRHRFHEGNRRAERRTWLVVGITLAMMVVEIAAGAYFNSMALLADGWHMGTHAAALGIAALAYLLARRHKSDHRYAFGTWKIEVLGGFASALLLGLVAAGMVIISVERLLHPAPIRYDEALLVAVVGLVVNVVCAVVIGGTESGAGQEGHHRHHHDGAASGHADHHHGGHDLNLRAAYLHVIADALTSVLAILALLGGKYMGWPFLDPLMGVAGAVLIFRWTASLLQQTSGVLLDREMDAPLVGEVRRALEEEPGAHVRDMHLWRVGPSAYACIVALAADPPHGPEHYKGRLGHFPALVHITVEVHDGHKEASNDGTGTSPTVSTGTGS